MTIAALDPAPKALPLRTRDFRSWLGLAAACLLAGTLTFLAGPARAVNDWAEALGQPMSPDAVGTGQLLVQAGESGPLYPVPTLDTDVQIQVSGLVARVRVSQSFRNPSADWLHGIYVFPLPEDSAVDHLRLTIGERVIEGEIQEKAKARGAYEAARDQGRSAALTEQLRPNLFRNSVANIGPGERVLVTIEYQQAVRYEAGRFSLRFPMTVGTRYIPGIPKVGGFDGQGWGRNTDQVPDASSITPPVTHVGQGPDNLVALTVDLDAGLSLAEVTSPYHPIVQEQIDATHHRVSLGAGTVPADRDFELTWRPIPDQAPQAALFTQAQGGDTYGLLLLVPPELGRTRGLPLPRELVFVIDTSGSMSGASIEQAKAALLFGLRGLQPGDRFNLVEFNSVTRALAPAPLPATPENLAQAERFVAGLRADGGTEMAAALRAVLDGKTRSERLRQVVFLTDGSVGNERELFDIIGRDLGDARLFTVGIGSAPNSHFMGEAASLGRGTFTYIGAVNEVEERMRDLLSKLEYPVLADIRLAWANPGAAAGLSSDPDSEPGSDPTDLDYAPKPLRDLYAQEPLVVSFRVPGSLRPGQELALSGRMNGQDWSTRVPMQGGGQARGLDVLWARHRIQALTQGLSRGAHPEEVRAETTRLGLHHHIVTHYTSLVALDQIQARPEATASRDALVPVKQPHGWDLALPQPRAVLPQTATPAGLLLRLGAALLLLALALGAWARRVRGA